MHELLAMHELLQRSLGEPGLILALGNAEELADRAIQDVACRRGGGVELFYRHQASAPFFEALVPPSAHS